MRNQTVKDTTRSSIATDLPEAAAQGRAPSRARALVIATAAVAALVTWLVADPILDVDLTVVQTPGGATTASVSAGAVVGSATVAGVLGWTALVLLERTSTRGGTIWRWLATAVALVSLTGPLTLAQTTGGTAVLTLLHLVVAGILLVALPAAGTASPAQFPTSLARRTVDSSALDEGNSHERDSDE